MSYTRERDHQQDNWLFLYSCYSYSECLSLGQILTFLGGIRSKI